MNDDLSRRIKEIEASDVTKRVKEIQVSMQDSAKSCLGDSQLGHLRAVIRITVEFNNYLEHGSVDIARGIQRQHYAGLGGAETRKKLQTASENPSNEYDLGYTCESVLSGVDSFWSLSSAYNRLDGATGSSVEWGMISSEESFKTHFVSMFKRFVEEAQFESKCRLLLDLFKLQIVFAGISYND